MIWVAKEARLFDKQGLDVVPVLIPSSVRTLQAILAGESAIAESAGPAAVSARLGGGGQAGGENKEGGASGFMGDIGGKLGL